MTSAIHFIEDVEFDNLPRQSSRSGPPWCGTQAPSGPAAAQSPPTPGQAPLSPPGGRISSRPCCLRGSQTHEMSVHERNSSSWFSFLLYWAPSSGLDMSPSVWSCPVCRWRSSEVPEEYYVVTRGWSVEAVDLGRLVSRAACQYSPGVTDRAKLSEDTCWSYLYLALFWIKA